MKALKIQGQRQLVIEDMCRPDAGNGRILIRVHACGICGSDLHLWNDSEGFEGLVLGHEFAGTVEDPGSFGDDFRNGDPVTVIPLAPCGTCQACREGRYHVCRRSDGVGWGEDGACSHFYAADARWVRKLPKSLGLDEAALLEPAAVVLHGLLSADLKTDDRVLVAGAGPIGLLTAHIAKALGAGFVALSELNPVRIEGARVLGDADEVYRADEDDWKAPYGDPEGRGFDLFVDCTGAAPAINTGLDLIREEGKVLLLGVSLKPVPLDTMKILLREARIVGSANYTAEHFDRAIALAAERRIDLEKFISRRISLEEAQETFVSLDSGSTADVKVLIHLNGD